MSLQQHSSLRKDEDVKMFKLKTSMVLDGSILMLYEVEFVEYQKNISPSSSVDFFFI
jgi:hypothetical protein